MKWRMKVSTLLVVVALLAVVFSWAIRTARENRKVFATDIVSVDVTEALPGRPITGTRLVMPDGSMSLGFYGKVVVAGLTSDEIRRNVEEHLRRRGLDSSAVSVRRVRLNSRLPNLLDWMTGAVGFRDLKFRRSL